MVNGKVHVCTYLGNVCVCVSVYHIVALSLSASLYTVLAYIPTESKFNHIYSSAKGLEVWNKEKNTEDNSLSLGRVLSSGVQS